MIVVTTPTGKIGSQALHDLLAANEPVRVVVRDPSKLPSNVHDQVEIVTGSLDDEAIMNRALDGAESLFLVVPPSLKDNNDEAYFLRFTRPALNAVESQRVKRVVAVSVLGRGSELAKNAGPITASLAKDKEIEDRGVDYRALWCPYLMENMLNDVQSIKQQGMIFSSSDANVKAPRVATKDVGAVAARLLRDRTWIGQGGQAVLGPQDLSYNEMAAIVSEALGKEVKYQQIPADEHKAQLKKYGVNEVFAQGVVDMLRAKDRGLDNAEPRTPENTTPTTFREWCSEVLRAAVLG